MSRKATFNVSKSGKKNFGQKKFSQYRNICSARIVYAKVREVQPRLVTYFLWYVNETKGSQAGMAVREFFNVPSLVEF